MCLSACAPVLCCVFIWSHMRICCVFVWGGVLLCVSTSTHECADSVDCGQHCQTNGVHSPTDQITAQLQKGNNDCEAIVISVCLRSRKVATFLLGQGFLYSMSSTGMSRIFPPLAVRSAAIDLSPFVTVPNYSRAIPSACLSVDSCLDK